MTYVFVNSDTHLQRCCLKNWHLWEYFHRFISRQSFENCWLTSYFGHTRYALINLHVHT